MKKQIVVLTLCVLTLTLCSLAVNQASAVTPFFSDEFESGSFSAWSGGSTTTGETRAVTTEVKYSGSYSARFTSNGGGGTEYAYIYKNIATRTPGSHLYVCGYFKVSTNGIKDVGDRFYFITLRAGNNDVVWAGWRKTTEGLRWELVMLHGSTLQVRTFSTSVPAYCTWYRVELHYRMTPIACRNGIAELYVNGYKVCFLFGWNNAYYGGVNSVRIGLPTLVNCASTKLYVDNVVFSTWP